LTHLIRISGFGIRVSEERRKVFCNADRSHAGTTAAVGNAKSLVKIQVAYIGADVAGPAQSDQRKPGRLDLESLEAEAAPLD
jgi:hypothetical protein